MEMESINEKLDTDQEMCEEMEEFVDEELKASSPDLSMPAAADRNFSSEDFKIELQNLPKYFGMGQMKKLINKKLKLNAHKLKPCGSNYMFVCFRNEEDKNKALLVLDGFVLKKNKLKATSARAASDPYKAKQSVPQPVDNRPIEERLQEALCPFAKLSYEEQLLRKMDEVSLLVKRLGSEISRANPDLASVVNARITEQGSVAVVQDIVRSPVIRGYRNKCEFSIGYSNTENVEANSAKEENGDTEVDKSVDPADKIVGRSEKKISVGFRLSTYKQGSIEVVSLASLPRPEDTLPHISAQMINIGVIFEQFVRASGILPYSSLTDTGNWRNLMLRSACDDQLMLVVVVEPMGLGAEKLAQIRSDLITFFTEGAGSNCKVTNLFLHLAPAKKIQGASEPVPELLIGEPVLTERLLNRSFSISPQAFFQVNSAGAEELYTCIGKTADLADQSTLVDVCCGTGTIGICLADKVKKVIGVELVPEAVRDAMKNAEKNGIENCSFFAGRAENIMQNVLRDIDSKNIVAVVDPPRAGLHNKALTSIRNNLNIRRLVFVACDAKAAMKNFVDLSRPASKTLKGEPLLPVKVIPVDLFPHTKHFELVLLFERISEQDVQKSNELADQSAEDNSSPAVSQ